MKKIGSLTPTITSPETMEAQCQFQFIDAHGSTMMNQLMIVPKDTFLLFVGPSGYVTYADALKSPLILTNNFKTKEDYLQNLYDTFFSPEDMTGKGTRYAYKGAQVYTPGDIIHDTNLSFYSGHEQGQVFFYGYHTLPITNPPPEKDSPIADPHTHHTMISGKTYYVPFISTAVARGLLDPRQLATLVVKPEVQDQWNKLITISKYGRAYDRVQEHKSSQKYDLSYWFVNPKEVMKYIITPYERSHPSNKLTSFPQISQPLSTLLEEYPNIKIGSSKQYRFVIILACRGPDVKIGTLHDPLYSNRNMYSNLPPSQLTLASAPQKLARRMSYSAKQPAEECPVGVGAPPMNLASVKKAMEDIAPHIKEYTNAPGGRFEQEFLRLIYESFFKIKPTVKVRILKKGELLSYDTTVNIRTFLRAIDMAFYPFSLLTSEDPAKADTKSRFQNVVTTFQNMVRAYATSAAVNDPMGPGRTVGEHMFNQIANVKTVLHDEYERKQIQKEIQTKLLRTNEGREAIRPITNEMSELYSELLTIFPINNTIINEYKEKIAPMMLVVSEEGYQAIDKVWNTYLTTSKTILTQVEEIRKKLERKQTELNVLIKRYPGISTLIFSEFDPRFKENPKLATFSIPKACEALLLDCFDIQRTMTILRTKIHYDEIAYTRDLYTVREKYKTVIQALTDETNAIQNYETSVHTFIQRKQAFQATLQRINRNKPIPEQTYQTNMKGLTTLLKEMKDFAKENEPYNFTSPLVKLKMNKDYETIFKNQPIESYAPEFRSPYTNNMKQTADEYLDNRSFTVTGFHGNLVSNIRAVERMIETYTNQYTTQQRASSSTQTRKNKPRNASMVSGASAKPKNTQRNRPVNDVSMVSGASGAPRLNQTRKKNRPPPAWVIKMRERQAKRNQTRRNGANGTPVIPKL